MATDRTGLYLMIIIIMLNTCDITDKVDKANGRLDRIEKVLIPQPEPRH